MMGNQDVTGALSRSRASHRANSSVVSTKGFDPARIVSGENYDNAVSGRVGNWMQTYLGGQFWPLDMRHGDIFIEDIAHALSLLCRYGGHCDRFYSVAEHSVLVSRVVPSELALLGLMHDATEAYVGDVIRPLKPALAGYKQIEHQVWLAVASRFGLPGRVPDEIKAADNAVLLAEQAVLMKDAPAPWCVGGEAAGVAVRGLAPADAEREFLERFAELSASGIEARSGETGNTDSTEGESQTAATSGGDAQPPGDK